MKTTASWAPDQATWRPNVDRPGDDPQAWASATPDGQKEWLEVSYDPPVLASSLSVYESYNPGAITEVQIEEVDPIADALPAAKDGFRTLAKGNQLDKQSRNGLGITVVTVKTNIRPIRRVRLLIDSPSVPGWNEIDAVGLLSTTGEMHWAKEANASSWFGDSVAMRGLTPRATLVPATPQKTVLGGVEVRDVSDLIVHPAASTDSRAQTARPDPAKAEPEDLVLKSGDKRDVRVPAGSLRMVTSPWRIKAVNPHAPDVIQLDSITPSQLRLVTLKPGQTAVDVMLEDDSTAHLNVEVTESESPKVEFLDFRFDGSAPANSVLLLDCLPIEGVVDVEVSGESTFQRTVNGRPSSIRVMHYGDRVWDKANRDRIQTSRGGATRLSLPGGDMIVRQVRILYRSPAGKEALPTEEAVGISGSGQQQVEWGRMAVAFDPQQNAIDLVGLTD
jgi:hypothetical protein